MLGFCFSCLVYVHLDEDLCYLIHEKLILKSSDDVVVHPRPSSSLQVWLVTWIPSPGPRGSSWCLHRPEPQLIHQNACWLKQPLVLRGDTFAFECGFPPVIPSVLLERSWCEALTTHWSPPTPFFPHHRLKSGQHPEWSAHSCARY